MSPSLLCPIHGADKLNRLTRVDVPLEVFGFNDIHPNTLRSRMKKLNIQRPCETPADAASAYESTSSS
jgi:hypothetical protein